MELVNDCIYLKKDISKNSSHFNITTDVVIPEFKSTLKKIINCYEDVLIRDISFDSNKVVLTGIINYNIVYYSPNYTLDSITHSLKFSHEISLPSIPPDSIFDATVNIENSEYEILNEHRIIIKHIAVAFLDHHQRIKIDVLSDVQDSDNIQILKNSIDVPNYLGHVCEKLFFKENIELNSKNSSIYQILKIDTNIKNTSYKIVDDKALVSTTFECNLLYLTDNLESPIDSFTFEKDLSQIVNMPGLTDTAYLNCSLNISDFNLKPIENADGEQNILDCEAIFDIHVYASLNKTIYTIEDAYSDSFDINLEKESLPIQNISQTLNENFYLKNTLPLNSNSSDINVYNLNTRILFSECKIINNKIILEGIVNVAAFIMDDTQQEKFRVLVQEYPIKHTLDRNVCDTDTCHYQINIDKVDYNINIENNLEFRINLCINANIISYKEITLSTNIAYTPLDQSFVKDKPNLIVYFTQKNDTLWSVAKKYLTTIDALKSINGLTNDSLEPNQQLLIM
ncbi:MAG: DUF3794 domain-containing protein [Clostridiales bacterium]|nr:DUF3794 domain-containing protein [Clostridiales bacterium]